MRIHSISIMLVGLCLVNVYGDEPPAKKLPIPDAAAQAETLDIVKDVYKRDYDNAQSSEQKIQLAKKLLRDGIATNEAVAQYVLLRVSRDIAAAEGDVAAALQVVDEMSQRYEVDGILESARVLATAVKTLRRPDQHKQVAEHFHKVIRDAAARDRYEIAKPLAELAGDSARQARDGELAKQAAARLKEIADAEEQFVVVKTAQETLASKPTDPDANLTVGRYHCFVKERWESGLAMLAMGSDETLQRLAAKDRSGAATAADQIELADVWWSLSLREAGTARERIQQRAAIYYQRALPNLVALEKVKVEKRLAQIPGVIPAEVPNPNKAPSPVDMAIGAGLNWLARQQRADGSWTFAAAANPGNLDTPIAATSLALLPYLRSGHTHLAGDYKQNVLKGLEFLARNAKNSANGADMREAGATMYGHGLASIAICEAYARTSDRKIKDLAQAVVNFIVYAQDPAGGGWRYSPRQAGDTSVFGWQLSALKTAHGAGLAVPPQTLQLAQRFLDSVQSDGGSAYGYTSPGAGFSTTCIGLLGRIHLGAKPNLRVIETGIEKTAARGVNRSDAYFNYYGTLLMQEAADATRKQWNVALQQHLLESQGQDGSWYFGANHVATSAGQIGITSLCIATLVSTNEVQR